MGRQVRMVPAKWEHPKDERGDYIPLLNRSILKYCNVDDPEDEQINPDELMPNFPMASYDSSRVGTLFRFNSR